jgi:hypothetical protein
VNKSLELSLFNSVYGGVMDWQVLQSESPDIVCIRNDSKILGVEITELWRNETQARLINVKNYAFNILRGGVYCHKNDVKNLRVEDIKYVPNGEEDKSIDLRAIISAVPNIRERVSLLETRLKAKEDKTPIYLAESPSVDLIVRDSSELFCFQEFEEIYVPISLFADRMAILNSSFREIFLVTGTKDNEQVYIPLKLNLFMEDIIRLENSLFTSGNFEGLDMFERIETIMYSLSSLSYTKLRISLDKEGLGFLIGCCLYQYSSLGKHIYDYSTRPDNVPPSASLDEALGTIGSKIITVAEQILNQKRQVRKFFPLYFPVKIAQNG